ncbi:myotrophin-like [Hydractinia symbiolongicarpus]|uniref:myotrophin-like n=1 Tax=Hydractinia symbiolongicarpus TaxID=13093 RepID=UPI00254D07C2|nr:myotrophin-like [Hydractinia symbiolongicarpus]
MMFFLFTKIYVIYNAVESKNGDVKTFQSILIDQPSIVKMRGVYETTLLMQAVCYNTSSIVKCLINAGSDVNTVDKNKWNAYHYSVCCGHHDVLKVLINHDVTNINNVSSNNNTPLHFASRDGHTDCVKLLSSIPHIDVNIRNKQNKTVYDVTCNNTIKRLLQEH